MRICYFGTYSIGEEYSRNNAIISGLSRNGIEVIQCHEEIWPTHSEKMSVVGQGVLKTAIAYTKTYLKLAYRYLRLPDHDIVFVGYIGHFDMIPARILCWIRSKPLVFDTFYSLYDTVVDDRGLFPAKSLYAKFLYLLDKWSCKLSDLSLLDTWAQVDFFKEKFRLQGIDFHAVPLGVDEKNFYPRDWPVEDGILECISYSSYIPLHGLEVQLEAADILRQQEGIHFTFVGKGQLYPAIRKRAEALNLRNVTFIEWASHRELVEMIADADICLGIFGTTQKASRVIPYKAYEALAMRKPLITGDSPAVRELLVEGVNTLLSPMGDAEGLARRILQLRDDPALRRRIAEDGQRLFQEKCTADSIARSLIDKMKQKWPDYFSDGKNVTVNQTRT